MSELPKCDYWECQNPISESEINSKDEMKFCDEHLREIDDLVKKSDARGVMRFWILSQGGAKRAAHRIIYGDEK